MTRRTQRRREAVEQVLDLTVDDHRVQAFLAAEVLVHDRLGNTGPAGDLLDRRAAEATFGEQRPADVEELLTALLTGHPDPARRGAGAGPRLGHGTHPCWRRCRRRPQGGVLAV